MTSDALEQKNLEAVRHAGLAIRQIEGPSESVKLEAVKQDGMAIEYIERPSDVIHLEAVKQNVDALLYINDPSEAIQLEAVKQNGYAIRRIKHQREIVQIAAVKQNGMTLEYIENPSGAVQLAAVRQNGEAIKYILYQSEAIKLEAIKQSELATQWIQWIETPPNNDDYRIVRSDDAVMAQHLIFHPDSDVTPPNIRYNAIAILNRHQPGLGDVYLMAQTLGYEGDGLRDRLLAHMAASPATCSDKTGGVDLASVPAFS